MARSRTRRLLLESSECTELSVSARTRTSTRSDRVDPRMSQTTSNKAHNHWDQFSKRTRQRMIVPKLLRP